ncbi:Anaerobic sulfatase-maturating enzyme [compost metagenome]
MSTPCAISEQSGSLGVMWKTVSEDCNLACQYCYYSNCKGNPGHQLNRIPSSLLETFIHQYMSRAHGNASFAWQGGEPLLAGKDFFKEVIALQTKHAVPPVNISNSLQTNGTLIDKEWAHFFKSYHFLVGVSLDGPQDLHDSRRVTASGQGSFKRVMRGIRHLQAADVDFNILTVIHDDNVRQAKAIMDFYVRENFQFIQFIPCMDFRAQQPDQPGKYLITAEQYGEFLCEAFDAWYNEGHPRVSVRFFDTMLSVYLLGEAELCTHRHSCPKTLILEQNGDAYPCDFYLSSDFKIGNIGVDSLDDILNNRLFGDFLSLKPKLPSSCITCPYLKLCHGGCPRNRQWTSREDDPGVDYFCQSYKMIFHYAHERIVHLAEQIVQRLRQEGPTSPKSRMKPWIPLCASSITDHENVWGGEPLTNPFQRNCRT